MKYVFCSSLISALLISGLANGQAKKPATAQKPNIIFVLVDDMGYGDVGAFFQNQRAKNNDRSEPWALTPNLDKMVTEGALLPQQYCAAPVCAPSRASILTGLSQGHANVRDNQFDKALADNYTVANVLKKAGYATAAIGKWGLQGTGKATKSGNWPAHPLNRGFDYYYGYMRHGDGHEHYPVEGVYRGAKEVYENKTEVSKGLDKCYTGDLWTAAAKKWIVGHEQGKNKQQPFFMYLAYDTPHAVLELPTCPYPAGGGLYGGVQWLGKPGKMINTAVGTVDSYTYPQYANATYDDDNNPSTPEVAWPDTYKRYASSTHRIDDAMGDLFKLLQDLKIDENTLVVFSSDNGPSVEAYLPKPHADYEANFFNSFGPFDGIKRDVLDGGSRMPVIARWPSKISPKTVINTPSISYDWLPTFTAAAGLPAPANSDGVSLLPSLTGKGAQKESLVYIEYTNGNKTPSYPEFAKNNRGRTRQQMQMIRKGDLVGIRYNIKSSDDDFEIYDIVKDTHQSNNLAASMPELQKQFKEKVLQVRRVDTAAARPYDNALVPAVSVNGTAKGVTWKSYSGNYVWLPNVSGLTAKASGTATSVDIQKIKKAGSNIYLIEGYINAPADGDYTFYLSSSKKAFLRIHEAAVIDADYGYTPGSIKQAAIKLKTGLHPFRIYYQGAAGKDALTFDWKGPAFAKTAVPASALSR